jgi:hypothetical protein
MRLLHLVPALLLSLSISTAFGGPPKPVKNTCGLSSVADLSAALKTQLKVAADTDGICIYNNAKGNMVSMLSASSLDTAAEARAAVEYAGHDSVKPPEAVPGVGDEAEIVYQKDSQEILVVRKGATVLLLIITDKIGSDFATLKPAIVLIGKQAAGRL